MLFVVAIDIKREVTAPKFRVMDLPDKLVYLKNPLSLIGASIIINTIVIISKVLQVPKNDHILRVTVPF